MGTAPSELTSAIATAHFAFEPRTSSAGRRTRSIRATTFRTPSITPATTISRRPRGERSFHVCLPTDPILEFVRAVWTVRPAHEDVPMDDRDDSQIGPHTLVARGLGTFELVLYSAVGVLLAIAAALVIAGTISGMVRQLGDRAGAVDVAVVVLDHVLLALIVGELLYTL